MVLNGGSLPMERIGSFSGLRIITGGQLGKRWPKERSTRYKSTWSAQRSGREKTVTETELKLYAGAPFPALKGHWIMEWTVTEDKKEFIGMTEAFERHAKEFHYKRAAELAKQRRDFMATKEFEQANTFLFHIKDGDVIKIESKN